MAMANTPPNSTIWRSTATAWWTGRSPARGVSDRRVLDAMREVPREAFVAVEPARPPHARIGRFARAPQPAARAGKAIPDDDLCNDLGCRSSAARVRRSAERRQPIRSERQCDSVCSGSPPLAPFSERLSTSTLSSSQPGSRSMPDRWFGNGPQQSARLCIAVFGRDRLGNSGLRGFRPHWRCPLDHRRDGDSRELALCLFRTGEHLDVHDPGRRGALRRSRAHARLGLLEWGQTAIGLGACCLFAWALALPA